MSFTSTVPASVPSVFHSSLLCTPSSAMKNSVPPTRVKPTGGLKKVASDEHSPGQMSFTSDVPAAVPSLFQSSRPCVPSFIRK